MQVLLPEDAEYLVRAMAQSCADVPYAARVGIAAVILNRVEDDRFPDTAAGVVSAWDAFDVPHDRPITDTEYRLCRDAYEAASAGADPTCGALNFETFEENLILDSPTYTIIIDNTAFW